MILSIIHNATFSQASERGRMRFEQQVGQMIAPSGRGHALANHSVLQEKRTDLMTSDTSGRNGIDSLDNADLALLLASRFQARTLLSGSTLYNLTWKKRTTPARGLIYALRGSVRHTSDNDCIGWPTPLASDCRGSAGKNKKELPNIAKITTGRRGVLMDTCRLTISGGMRTGYNVKMKSGGRLSPDHSRWLMGIPREWSLVAPKSK